MILSSRLQAVKNVFASWFGLVTTVIVGFFLTPYILHRLGDTAFGLWVLLSTFTGYYGLLDLGIRNAIVRYVARYSASGDINAMSRVVSTSFFTYSLMAGVLILLTTLSAWKMELLFDVSPQWRSDARLLLAVVGVGTALGMPLNLFGGVLEGLQRFTWVGMIQAVLVLARAAILVPLLANGYGIVTVGVVTVAGNLVASLIYGAVVFRLCPELRLHTRLASRGELKDLASFGIVTFWVAIAQVFRFQMDSMVIAGFLSLQAVTFFAISSKLASYMTDFVQAMAQVFTPMSSALDASGDKQGLRWVLTMGNRYAAFLSFPLAAVLLISGPSILYVWVGPSYLASYPVLAILTIPTALYLAQAGSPKVLYGMARHRTLALALFIEGIANLILSLALAKPMGIEGVAIGTAIPLAVTSVFFLPIHLCRLLQIRVWDFAVQAFAYPLACVVPLCLSLVSLERWLQPKTWAGLLAELIAGAMVYGLTLLIYFYRVEHPVWERKGQAWQQPMEVASRGRN